METYRDWLERQHLRYSDASEREAEGGDMQRSLIAACHAAAYREAIGRFDHCSRYREVPFA